MLTRRMEIVKVRKRLAWIIVVVMMALGGCGAPGDKGPAPEDLLPASGSVPHLTQVVMNLVNNAFEAMPNGGKLTIRTRASDKFVLLEVGDTGVGMEENIKNQILIVLLFYQNVFHGLNNFELL